MFELRPYQKEIAEKACVLLKEYKIAYLSLQMRVGKTLCALYTAELYGATNVLFLTKKKAKQSIIDDNEKLKSPFNLTVINYEQAIKLTADYDLVICDESQNLGQFPIPAKKIHHIKKICEGCPIIYLSASPSPEAYSQLYHQFFISSFSPWKEYKNFYSWAKSFVLVKKKYVFNRQFFDYSNAIHSKVEASTKHLFLSYTQEQAGFVSPVEEVVLSVKMKDSTYNLARRMQTHRVYITKNGNEILADTEVKLMSKLHQIFSGSVIDEKGEALAFDDSKVAFVKDRFKGQKIAIFYKYRGEEMLIRAAFDNLTLSPEEFNTSTDKTFLSQVSSGREGINLSTADCLVMLNIDFSFVNYYQSRARLQSKDREKAAMVYWIFSEGGIEHKIYERVLNKKSFTTSYFQKQYGVK